MRKLQWLPLVSLLSLFFLSCPAFSDQVTMKNGDRLTGTITKSDNKALVIKSDFAGEVTIQWDAVDQISSSGPLHVATQDGKTVVGPVTTSDGNLTVATTGGGTVNVAKANVTGLRNDAEEAAYEKTLHPTLLQGWAGGASVGFALTRGNSETKNLSLAFNADRKTSHDEISSYANTVYSANDAVGATPSVTANTIQAGARYSRNLTKRVFGYGGADFQTDALQALNLRSILGGGLGFHAINTDRTTLDFLGGLNYTRENYGPSGGLAGFNRNFAALTLGEEFMHKLGTSTVISEKGYVFPDLSQTGQYRATFNFGTITKISKWLGWQNAFGDIYVTNPPVGKKDNDIILTTGLNVSFTH